MLKEISTAFLNAENIIILPHKSADADCLGSAFALKLILEKIGKRAAVVLEEKEPQICKILHGVEPETGINPDLVAAVDCGDLGRLGTRTEIFESCPNTVNLDHHPTNTLFAKHNYVDSAACATGEIIFALAELMDIPLDVRIAENLYAAITSDCGRFSYNSVTAETHIITSKLHRCGIDHVKINEFLFERNSMPRIMLLQRALNSLEVHCDGKLAAISLTRADLDETGALDEDISGLITYPRSIETALIAVCLRESTVAGKVKVSLRSNVFNVAEVAAKFGGGGHVRASGCTVKGSLEEAKQALFEVLFGLIRGI